MKIGIDFDNTLVCYDTLFFQVALEKGLVPVDLEPNKIKVRDYLRSVGREDDWTEMQGYVYGPRLAEAEPYPGAAEFFQLARDAGHELIVVSHKTIHPYKGPAYDLHAAARSWLKIHPAFADTSLFLEVTKRDKVIRVGREDCAVFIDDLPEIFAEPDFPKEVVQVLFDPMNLHTAGFTGHRAGSWAAVSDLLLGAVRTA